MSNYTGILFIYLFYWFPYEFNGDMLESNSLLSDLK